MGNKSFSNQLREARSFILGEKYGPIEADIQEIVYSISEILESNYKELNRLKRKNKKLESRMFRDSLTGITNRGKFDILLKKEIKKGELFSLLFFDLDYFKKVNDTYGHLSGDLVLKKIANEIKTKIKSKDIFARYGGEEFIIVLPGTNIEGGKFFSQRIRKIIKKLKIKKENPKLIYNIRQKSNKSSNKKFLSWENMNNIKHNSYIKGNSGANITILEFSDLECPYCIELHNEGTIKNILKNNSGSISYIFKNFPLPKHKNSEKEAIAGKCIDEIAGGEKYLSFIDNIFKTTKGGGEGYNLNNIEKDIENLGINKDKFNSCYTDKSSIKLVVDEFNLGIKLGINSTPSNMIINNTTGEYILLKGKAKESEFNDAIEKIK